MSGGGSPRRSCRRGRGSRRGWRRCCRCCICTACPARTSGRRWSSSSAPTRACPRRRSPGSPRQWQDEARAFNDRSLAGTRLRLRVGRRHPPQGAARAGQGVPAGDHRRPRRRPQGAGRAGRRVPRVSRVVGRPAPRLQTPRDGGAGARGRRRGARVLEGGPRRVPRNRPSSGAGGTRSATCSPPCPSRPTRPRRRRWPRSTTPRTRPTPEAAAKAFAAEFGAKWPKATAKITDDLDVLLAFYDFPAEHWIHLRTTNPIESTFATVRLRQRVTKGPGSRAAGVAMAFKLIESAQTRWRMRQRTPPGRPGPRRRHASTTANSSNDPTTKINKEVTNKPRETRRSTGLDYSSGRAASDRCLLSLPVKGQDLGD